MRMGDVARGASTPTANGSSTSITRSTARSWPRRAAEDETESRRRVVELGAFVCAATQGAHRKPDEHREEQARDAGRRAPRGRPRLAPQHQRRERCVHIQLSTSTSSGTRGRLTAPQEEPCRLFPQHPNGRTGLLPAPLHASHLSRRHKQLSVDIGHALAGAQGWDLPFRSGSLTSDSLSMGELELR